MLSEHATKRSQQRGITNDFINAAVAYGEVYRQQKADVFWVTRRSIKQMIADGFKSRFAEDCSNIYVVLNDAIVITVAHKNKKFKR